MQQKRLESNVETMRAIASGNSVREFYIGFTSRDAYRYWAWYRRNGYPHAVILADRLNETDAKRLEKRLQERCRKADKRTVLWQKGLHKYGRYRLGAKSSTPEKPVHVVYMAWKN